MANTHPSVETIERFVMKRLPEAELAPFEEHLLLCPKCQDMVAEADQDVLRLKAATRRLEHETPHWKHRVQKHHKPIWAAAAAALILVFYIARPHHSAPPQVIALTTLRGSSDTSVAKSGAPIQLKLDAAGLPARETYLVEVVDASGAIIATQQSPHTTATVDADCKPLESGQYWVRVSAGGRVLREFSLPVR